MALKGGLAGVIIGVSALVIAGISIVLCIACAWKRSKLIIAGEQLLRAAEPFAEATEMLQESLSRNTEHQAQRSEGTEEQNAQLIALSCEQNQPTIDNLLYNKNMLERIGHYLIENETPYNWNENDSLRVPGAIESKVADLLVRAIKSIKNAGSQLDNAKLLKIGEFEEALGHIRKDNRKDNGRFKRWLTGCCPKAPFPMLLSLHSLVFRLTVKQGMTHREYLFGGYRYPKNICMLHTYYLPMLFVVFNWFIMIFIDNAFYAKTTTCNDPRLNESDYQCFDLTKPRGSGPVDCSEVVPGDPHVICYIRNLRLAYAVSLAYGVTESAILVTQVLFIATLWCTKKGHCGCAIIMNLFLTIVYTSAILAY